MTITHVLAVAPVTDIDKAADWYSRLLGRSENARPMETLADFHVTGSGWLQVVVDPDHAGQGQINFAVDDFDTIRTRLLENGFDVTGEYEATGGVRLLPLADPDGNAVTVIGGLRDE